MRRRVAVVLALVLAPALAGCGDDEVGAGAELTVYVSLPLRGDAGTDGRDAMRGARLALADAGERAGELPIRAVYLDDTSGPAATARWDPVRVAANARMATEDSNSIAYVGDLHSGATRTSLPITNSARLLHVSPASSAADLVAPFPGSEEVPENIQTSGDRTFGRVIPDRDAVRQALRAWPGVRTAGPVGSLPAGTRLPLPSDSRIKHAVSAAQDPSQLPQAGQEFVRDFERQYGEPPGRYAAYGYEAMAVVLDAIDRAADGNDRQAVIDAFLDTEDRDSVLGTYSIDEVGNTTLDRLAGYRIEESRLVFEEALRVP